MSSATLEIVPVAAALGAEVRCADVRTLDTAARARIRRAWLENLVLLIRGPRLTDDELVAVGRIFGEPDAAPLAYTSDSTRERGHPEVIVISNVTEGGVPIGVLGDAEVVWHSDNSYRETPLSASALHALELPAGGGETGFVNMYLALETLAPELRKRVAALSIKHDSTYNSAGQLRKGFQPVTDVRTAPGPLHPVIRRHPETGCDALYLGRRPNAYVDGLSVEESERLLDALWSHATRPEHAWHHRWQPGDILVWDNRCVMHHRNPFDPSARRVMHRIQCKGERPIRSPGTSDRGRHPRAAAIAR